MFSMFGASADFRKYYLQHVAVSTGLRSHTNCAGVRRTSVVVVRPYTSFSQKPSSGFTPNFGDRYICTISPDHFSPKFSMFDFLRFSFFVFVNMGPYGRKNFTRHRSSESTHRIHSPKWCIFPVRVSTKVVQIKICEISNFGFLTFFSSA